MGAHFPGGLIRRRDPRDNPTFIETLAWTRRPTAAFNTNPNPAAWDHENVYTPVLCRNLDRTPYRDADGNLFLYYNGDNTPGTDLDQIGLAIGPTLDTLVRYGTAPVIARGTPPAVDAGDAQVSSVWFTGSKFLAFYQGNATPPDDSTTGDKVTMQLAESSDGKAWSKLGTILATGPNGDFEDLYTGRVVPNAPGGPRFYYLGKNANLTFGIMCAVSRSGSLYGPWTRLSEFQLLRNGSSAISDAWYEDEQYHLLYAPGGSPGGIRLATSKNGMSIRDRALILPRNIGFWDTAPAHAGFHIIDGVPTLLYNSSSTLGIGYVTGN